jgi:CheY-like chemotaxis protein
MCRPTAPTTRSGRSGASEHSCPVKKTPSPGGHFAASGEGALALLTGGIEPSVAVILSDINMPGMDGLQLLGEIKQHFPDLPVMMVSAYGDADRRRSADELGAADFLTKPVDFALLKAQLRQLPTAAN